MEIHIKNQTAGVITHVEHQVINGGLHGSVVTDEDARQAVRALWSVTPQSRLRH